MNNLQLSVGQTGQRLNPFNNIFRDPGFDGEKYCPLSSQNGAIIDGLLRQIVKIMLLLHTFSLDL